MYLRLAKRFLFETDKRLLTKAAWILGVKGLLSVHRHKRRLKRGEFFPPFLYLSVINSCNLRCQGCWVDVAAKQEKIEVDAVNETIRQAKAKIIAMSVTPLVLAKKLPSNFSQPGRFNRFGRHTDWREKSFDLPCFLD